MSLFDSYLMVDWSASANPKTGPDSIWYSLVDVDGSTLSENPATRYQAMADIRRIIERQRGAKKRTLIGFDFAFGYPRGFSQAVRPGGNWRDAWSEISKVINDDENNRNNRFHAAGHLNSRFFSGEGPFWGNGLRADVSGLPRTKPKPWPKSFPANLRAAETASKNAQEVWKLSGAGSVGGQALTGIALLEQLRSEIDLSVWPFESPTSDVVLAEIFPSMLNLVFPLDSIRDQYQVESIARVFQKADSQGLLERMLDRSKLSDDILRHEAAILGQRHVHELQRINDGLRRIERPKRSYLKDPAAIYAESFATVRREARLDRFGPGMEALAIRLIHACGMVEVADRLAFSQGAFQAGAAALAGGAPVLCDCEMVAAGVIRRSLPAGNEVVVTLNDPSVSAMAARLGTTRSAAAVELWRDRIEGAVVAVGNAPTALFHLLERLDAGWPKPAVILGFPVGFVGAAESKAELAANPRGCDFVALKGRRGGSAIASAAVNALAAGLPGE